MWLLIAVSQLWGSLFQKVSRAGDTVTPHIWDIYNRDCPEFLGIVFKIAHTSPLSTRSSDQENSIISRQSWGTWCRLNRSHSQQEPGNPALKFLAEIPTIKGSDPRTPLSSSCGDSSTSRVAHFTTSFIVLFRASDGSQNNIIAVEL
jgi:hypothetical protein